MLLFLLAFKVQAGASVTGELEEIYGRYRSLLKEPPETRIKLLIGLDQDLRNLVDKPWMIANRSINKMYWREKYQEIGVGIGHYSGILEYSGKPLAEARALDANSTYGSYTRYADICGGLGSFAGRCRLPDLAAALRYEKDFPNGPFMEDTLITLGNFYDDLSKVLKGGKQGYKYDCFSRYLRDGPVATQRELARTLALHYFAMVLARGSANRAANRAIMEWKSNLESGENLGWHFCAD